MIVNGFCKEVFRELPMEFAVEAGKLLEVSLEGSGRISEFTTVITRVHIASIMEIKKPAQVRVEGKEILNGLSIWSVGAGEVHAIMGPNGSGKSTLGYVLSGRDGYEVVGRLSHL